MSSLSKSELKEIMEEVLEERIGSLKSELSHIKSAMMAQYLNSIGRLLEREAQDTIENFACNFNPTAEEMCKGMLKDYISRYTNALAMGDLANAFSVLSEFESEAEANSKNSESHCKKDWNEILRILRRHKEVAKDLSAQFTARKVPADIGEIDFDPEELYESVVFPIAHILRIQIIHALKNGAKRFTTLKNELNVKNTGLLVHHLKPLTEAGLVEQDFAKKYNLTDKGFLVARYFAQITAAINPQEPEEIFIGNQPPHITRLSMIQD